ncbi:anhydro-N-acetylmuramic acid kinase [Polaribacter septentrionalilitoris]|uniref:anhydro-N-acetylmuramic acid kinase n=1 Tax=Polaribacter septentrionalilitoris TaxID=2494657 RepID=UPI001356E330|nr:anhydro-N-acetylmuramic acid kinase [Polaribacter septentrionalilitoris]
MNKDYVFVIGLMSGTSLDGIDLVYVKFDKNDYRNFEIIEAETVSYSSKWKKTLQKAIEYSGEELKRLDNEYGCFLGETINNFTASHKINKIDFIASHGHTILHQPKKGITLQIGSGKEIAKITNTKVVCDFRTQDVKLGGQGAPLVPVGDELLFSNYDYCLNLGGFSNVSFKKVGKRVAFDICPVNIVLNHYVAQLGFQFDDKGQIASKGTLNQKLLDELNRLEFYKKIPPKSLGLEWVQDHVFPLIDRFETNIPSILRTFVEHIAIQISKIIDSNSILITGGGAFNSFLISKIQAKAKIKITLPNKQFIDFKEALIFAFLGVLRVDNQVNCLSSVTGALKDHSSGVVFCP